MKWLKSMIGLAGLAGGPVLPVLGIALRLAEQAVRAAAERPQSGERRKQMVMDALRAVSENAGPGGLGVVRDPERFTRGLDQIVEGVLDVLKATGDVETKPPVSRRTKR